jgi:hypothetical protein
MSFLDLAYHLWDGRPRLPRRVRYYQAIRARDLPPAAVADLYRSAWRAWARACGIEPTEVRSAKEADVAAFSAPIDGPFGELAYSILPIRPNPGPYLQVYDASERWPDRLALKATMLHEIGHSLGLDHGPPGSIMAPTADLRGRSIGPDDVAPAVARYGGPRP